MDFKWFTFNAYHNGSTIQMAVKLYCLENSGKKMTCPCSVKMQSYFFFSIFDPQLVESMDNEALGWNWENAVSVFVSELFYLVCFLGTVSKNKTSRENPASCIKSCAKLSFSFLSGSLLCSPLNYSRRCLLDMFCFGFPVSSHEHGMKESPQPKHIWEIVLFQTHPPESLQSRVYRAVCRIWLLCVSG